MHTGDAPESYHPSAFSCAELSRKMSLKVIFEDHERLKIKAEVSSQLGRSSVALKNKNPRRHSRLGHGLVSSK